MSEGQPVLLNTTSYGWRDESRPLMAVNTTEATLQVDISSAPGKSVTGGMPCSDTWLYFTIYGPLYALMCVFGLVGNCLSICVLRTGRSRKAVSTYLLTALAVSDNVFLTTAAAVQMYPAMATLGGYFDHLERIYPYYQMLAWPLAHIVQLVSVWMMVVVAGNRYLAVCRPLHASTLCSKRNVQCEIVVMVTACVVYSLPRFAEFRYEYVNATELSLTSNDSSGTLRNLDAAVLEAARQPGAQSELIELNVGLAANRVYNVLYENIAYCLMAFLVPLSTLVFFNVRLVMQLRRSRRLRRTLRPVQFARFCTVASRGRQAVGEGGQSVGRDGTLGHGGRDGTGGPTWQDDSNITLVMVVIVVVFIICELPASANQLLYYVVDEASKTYCSLYMRFYHVCNVIITINSASNFVIYCLFRRQFQRQLRQMAAASCTASATPLVTSRRQHASTVSESQIVCESC